MKPFVATLRPGSAQSSTRLSFALLLSLLLSALPAMAQEAAKTEAFKADTGDTAWVLTSAALVLLMTPGLAFFYGGLVRSKNMLNTLMMSFGAMAVMAMVWFVAAYSIAFGSLGETVNGKFEAAAANNYWGGLQHMFLNGVNVTDAHPLAATIPHQAFMIFQMMFFIITPALISGSLVERMKFGPYLAFIALWGLLVYAPVAHWVWNGGFIGAGIGAIDFAGGAVVHVNAGFAALAGALALKPRRGYNESSMRPHNLPLCLLGVGLLWFGWYGFNAGSALGAGSLATVAFVNTTLGAAAAMFAWMMIDLITRKEITALGAGTGAVAGLVGITPACGFVTPGGAILIGMITAGVCYVMATLRAKGPVDDSLDAFAVHGVGGFTGAVLTGLFANEALKTAGVSPASVAGGFDQMIKQLLGTGIVAIYSFVVSFILFKILQAVMGLRVNAENEERGLDVSVHGEEAYA
ncbi:MAG TPA: ammonium transporter, partial [Abditibacteriaceae bacterium]|nr:ammonium transporter [Abditibacteriaceae bacterium]